METKMKPRVKYTCPSCGQTEKSVWTKPIFKCKNCKNSYDNCSISNIKDLPKLPKSCKENLT